MLKVFEKVGYRFFFYSNEHRPIHVHVRYGSGEAVLDAEAEDYRDLIITKWHERLG